MFAVFMILLNKIPAKEHFTGMIPYIIKPLFSYHLFLGWFWLVKVSGKLQESKNHIFLLIL